MLIVRAPVRISFGGGGTDFEDYWSRYGGLVLSAAIKRYCYVIITEGSAGSIQISSADMRRFNRRIARDGAALDESSTGSLDGASDYLQGDLKLPWAVLQYFGIDRGLDIFLATEVPPGTGLGSSSTVAVALVKALAGLSDHPLSRYEVAEIASHVEIGFLGMPIGRQDQYASAFGGLNTIYFEPGNKRESIRVEPVQASRSTIDRFEQHLMLFFTGTSRNSEVILREQQSHTKNNDPSVVEALHAIKALALDMREALLNEDFARFGELLDRSWQHKKGLSSGITNEAINTAYSAAMSNGAWGGKITGAGGGGFLLLCCATERQEQVTNALAKLGLSRMSFRFDRRGATVLFNGGDIELEDRGHEYLTGPLYPSRNETNGDLTRGLPGVIQEK